MSMNTTTVRVVCDMPRPTLRRLLPLFTHAGWDEATWQCMRQAKQEMPVRCPIAGVGIQGYGVVAVGGN